jgi:hypothetical protein
MSELRKTDLTKGFMGVEDLGALVKHQTPADFLKRDKPIKVQIIIKPRRKR